MVSARRFSLLLLCCAAALSAVPLPADCYGTAGYERARAIAPAPDNGWYLAGTSVAGSSSDTNLLVIRVDSLGNPLWARTNLARASGEGADVVASAVTDADGGVVLAGWTSSYGAFRPPAYPQNSDILLCKLDPAGNLVWGRTFGRSGNDRAWSVARTTTSPGFIIAGSTDSGPNQQIIVIKTDPLGNRLWQRRYTFGGARQEALGIVETRDPSFRYAVCGRANINSPNDYDAWLMTLDSVGNPLWPWGALTIEGTGDDEAWSVVALPGFITVAGWSNSFGTGGGPDADILVFHSNLGGSMLNPRVIGWAGFEEKLTGDRALVGDSLSTRSTLAGWTYAKGSGTPVHPNMLIMRIDGGSNAIPWSRLHPSIPGELAEQAHAIARTATGYGIAGWTSSHWTTGNEDFHFVTLDTLGNRPFCTLDSTPLVRAVTGTIDTLYSEPAALTDSNFATAPATIGYNVICTLSVAVADVGVSQIVAPAGTIDSGTVVTPACSLDNFGPVAADYSVRCRIGGFYDETATVSGHAPGSRIGLVFPAWIAAPVGGPWGVTCSTELAGDPNSANNRAIGSVIVRRPGGRDVGVTVILAPAGMTDSGTSVTPACSVRNYGANAETYPVRLRIGSAYNQTVTVTNHQPGTTVQLTFPAWIAAPVGPVAVSCSTELDGDDTPANDRATGSVLVLRRGADVGVTRITAPAGVVPLGNILAPACSVFNFGNTTAAYNLRFVTSSGYDAQVAVSGHAPGTARQVLLPAWTAGPAGDVYLSAWTLLAGDIQPANDTSRDTCRVVASGTSFGWLEVAPMPLAPSGKTVKDGGWLAYNPANGLLYAAKGNKTGDFYAYDPGHDNWLFLPLVPDGVEGRPVGKGAAGTTDGNTRLFCVKGNNTVGFWRFAVDSAVWRPLADVPLGPSNKRVKGGGDLVYVNGPEGEHVYLLKGVKNEFWRYTVAGDSWLKLPDAPARPSPKYDRGSFLVADNAGGIYVHKARTHELYRFDIVRNEWDTLPRLAGMPLLSRSGQSKRSKDGGCGSWYQNGIYALKGGNTQEFWYWSAPDNRWSELDTIPAFGNTGRKKRIKAGADIAAVGSGLFYALKGNKTAELWRYLLPLAPDLLPPVTPTTAVSTAGVARPALVTITPNPLAGGTAVLRWTLPRPGPATIKVFDITGRTVLVRSLSAGRSGATGLDLRRLSAGVYLVQFTAGSCTSTHKLVIER